MITARVLRVPEDFMPQHADVTVQAAEPLADLEVRLEALHMADKAAERTRARIRPWLWVTGVGFFLGFVFVFPLVLGIPWLILLYFHRKAGAKDVEDRRLDVARHLLDTLRYELDPNSNVVLEMDFSVYSKTRARREGGVTFFEQPWMRLGMVLRDGSALQVSAKTLCKRKSKRKRKYTKHKDQLVEELTLEIRPAKGQSFEPGAQGRIARALARPLPAAALRRCKIKPRVAELAFATERAVRTEPRTSFLNREHLLDAEKVLTLTTLGYRAATRSSPA